MDLDRGAAIVTGAAGGIGAVTAARLAASGMGVVLADIDGDRLDVAHDRLRSEIPGGEFVAVRGDVGDPEHHAELVDAAGRLPGGLRLSVLNAGVSVPGLSWEMPLETWELTTRVNYWGVVHGLRAALGTMVPKNEGWVVAVSSGAGLVASPGLAPYVATKHAVVGLMESTHHELARIDSQVGVSVICPGNIATGMPDRGAPDRLDAGEESAYPDAVRALAATIRTGVESGADPASVAVALADGVAAGRFWVLPQPELAWAATDRARRILDNESPVDLLG